VSAVVVVVNVVLVVEEVVEALLEVAVQEVVVAVVAVVVVEVDQEKVEEEVKNVQNKVVLAFYVDGIIITLLLVHSTNQRQILKTSHVLVHLLLSIFVTRQLLTNALINQSLLLIHFSI
jgi:hypothetical protein